MSEEIRPALSAEEWGQAANPLYVAIALSRHAHTGERLDALAALALQHAGPDGGAMFTWEDVDALRQVIAEAECNGNRECPGISQAESIVDCIAALLPPRGP